MKARVVSTIRGLMAVAATAALYGCVLAPNSLRPEVEHMSHLSQHQPFTDEPNSWGVQMVNIIAHWDLPHAYIEIGEGFALNAKSPTPWDGAPRYGEIVGNREQFTARAGIIIPLK
jgi:hypothetical protein